MLRGRVWCWCALLAVAFSTNAVAEEQPLWEAGVGPGILIDSEYRGSDETRVLGFPIPTVLYRGKYLKGDADGARIELATSKIADFNIGLSYTLPLLSEDNTARRDMPNLRATLDFAPTLAWHLWRSPDAKTRVDLDLGVRLPVTVSRTPDALGAVLQPRLHLKVDELAGVPQFELRLVLGPNFAADTFHEYYYNVAPRFATADRPAFEADGGYSGSTLMLTLEKRTKKLVWGAALRYENLSGAAFTDSPLFKRSNAWFVELGVAYMFLKSERMAPTSE